MLVDESHDLPHLINLRRRSIALKSYYGQAAPQVMTSPLGQMTGAPAAQSTMSHPSVPASAAGQWTTQAAPAAQLVWQGDAEQVNEQVLPASQTHCPLAHVPEQLLFGSQVT